MELGETLVDGSNVVRIETGLDTVSLRARWIGAGWPQDVREALVSLDPDGPAPRDLILVARQLSPGARELVDARSVNWVDETGGAHIVAPGILVSKDGSAKPVAERAVGWSPSAAEIAELLLSRAWPEGFGTTELANLSGWSSPQVSQVLQSFDQRGWTSKYGPGRGRGAKRELADVDDLLESWVEIVQGRAPATREASRTFDDATRFLEQELAAVLNEHVRWAITGWAAAQEASPFVTMVPTLQIYVHEDDMAEGLNRAIRTAGLRDVPEGGRVQFFAAPASLLGRCWTRNELPLASPPRIYADLKRLGPRGWEAAEHLKEEVIDPLHRAGSSATGPPEGLLVWERETGSRLRARIKANPDDDVRNRYAHGTYSATYRLQGVREAPTLPRFKAMLQEVVGRETGWPAWLMPERPRSYENTIEAWFDETVFDDPAHADFWRADPGGRMCLIRGYDEDGVDAPVPAGTCIDLTLPIWRVGECLLHARRLADRLSATRVEFMMRWTGLADRKIASYAAPERRRIAREYRCHQEEVVSYVESSPAAIEPRLPQLVESLVSPLYSAFEFFEPPADLYGQELERMRRWAEEQKLP